MLKSFQIHNASTLVSLVGESNTTFAMYPDLGLL
jgi:hypothetical protein